MNLRRRALGGPESSRSAALDGAPGRGYASPMPRARPRGPKVTRMMLLMAVKDRRALRAHLDRLAATPDLTRVLIMHGIHVNGLEVLREAAASL